MSSFVAENPTKKWMITRAFIINPPDILWMDLHHPAAVSNSWDSHETLQIEGVFHWINMDKPSTS